MPAKNKFDDLASVLKEARAAEPVNDERAPTQAGRARGKRSDPECDPTTLLIRSEVKFQAKRKLEDRHRAGHDLEKKDLSELVTHLLQTWIERSGE